MEIIIIALLLLMGGGAVCAATGTVFAVRKIHPKAAIVLSVISVFAFPAGARFILGTGVSLICLVLFIGNAVFVTVRSVNNMKKSGS